MKIVSVMTTESPSGGAEFAAVEMLDALIDRGHDTVLLTSRPEMVRTRRVRAVTLELGPKLSTRSYLRLVLRLPLLVVELNRALEREQPYDILLLHYKKEQLLSLLLRPRLRRTIVWAEWGPIPFPLRKGIPRRLYLAAARRARLVLAISEGTRRSVCDVGVDPEKVVVVPNVMRTDEIEFRQAGRDRVRQELGIPGDAFVVGLISRFHPKKRNDVVVEAVIALDNPAVHLILAGDGETEASLRAIGKPLGDRLHIVPPPGGDVADMLSAFDVSVFCPSPTEGAPRAVLLGMLAARPCLSTGAEGVADIITPGIGEITSPENDPDALRDVLRGYLADPARLEREGANARREAEETYAAPVVASRLEALLDAARSR